MGCIVYGFRVFRVGCCLTLFGLAVLSGCDDIAPPPERPAEPPTETSRDFNPATAGAIRGQVVWEGAIPEVPPYRAPVSPAGEQRGGSRYNWPNPNAPKIDPRSKAVTGAVVFLRGIDLPRARSWDHPPVRIELRGYQIHVCQGERDGPSGFVRRGDAITLVSVQDLFHSLQLRGAAFLARTFADRDRPCTQRLDRAGVVEMMSGCGYFWMRGRLFVDDHPYYTHTDAEGRFLLPQVPPGQYELVCWLPDWHEARRELDADTALLCRLTFRPAVEIVQTVRLDPRQTRTASIRLPAGRFGP
jgi:hypothetical protein